MAKFGSGDKKVSNKVRYPRVTLPRIARGTRNPKGWGSTEISIRGRGFRGLGSTVRPMPAGLKPDDFSGTQPEWSVRYGLIRNGLVENQDFTMHAQVSGAGAGYYSQIDFYIPAYSIGIEVQGRFWHLGQGSRKILTDVMRINIFAQQGIKVVFIDEDHANADPVFYVREALQGRDHSHVATGRRSAV